MRSTALSECDCILHTLYGAQVAGPHANAKCERMPSHARRRTYMDHLSSHAWRARSARVRERLRPKQLRAPSLDWLNFLVADVRGALGPFITVYLVDNQGWSTANVGLVTSLGSWAGLLAQTPIGAWIDHTRYKRGILFCALVGLSAGALVFATLRGFWPVLFANGLIQIVSQAFTPTIAALTVGLFSRDLLTRRMGRNAAWARGGNMVVAGISGVLAWFVSRPAVFLQVPLVSALAAIAVLSIPHGQINQRRARGLRSGSDEAEGPAGWIAPLRSRPVLVFGACSFLYELADPPLLTLVGQEFGGIHKGWGLTATSALVIASQGGMLLSSIVVGRRADSWGYRWMLAAAFALLPMQAALTLVSHNAFWRVGVQFSGGLGTGLFVALTPLWLADATHGTGRYNLSQGLMGTLRALGVSTSALVSEVTVGRLGYDFTYVGCGVIGAAAFALLWFALPAVQRAYD